MNDIRTAREGGANWVWIVAFAVLAVVLRLVPAGFPREDLTRWSSFFSAVGALGLFAGARLGSKAAYFVPLGVMLASDLLLLPQLGRDAFSWMTPIIYASYTLNVVIGRLIRPRSVAVWVVPASLLTAAQFFLVTNFTSWLGGDGVAYPLTFAGLIDCYRAGLPFFKYGDLIYAIVFFGLHTVVVAIASRQKVSQPA
jgi:hypothetical protein